MGGGLEALGGDRNQGPENPPSRVQFDLVGFKVCFININWTGGTNCLSGTKVRTLASRCRRQLSPLSKPRDALITSRECFEPFWCVGLYLINQIRETVWAREQAATPNLSNLFQR